MKTDSLKTLVQTFDPDQASLLNILIAVQEKAGFISPSAKKYIAKHLNISEAEVSQTLTFYHFLSERPRGKNTIYLNNSVVATMMGAEKVKEAFEKAAGCSFGDVSKDGEIGLFETSCIGMNDQEPAALINGEVFTCLTPLRAKEIIEGLRKGKKAAHLHKQALGDGQNRHPLLHVVVNNHIRRKGHILADNYTFGKTLRNCLLLKPDEIVEEIKASNLRGRGGAGFPTGFKWEACKNVQAAQKYVFCNADEGEPGTFKDRVILTEKPYLLIEGMLLAAKAIGASKGIIYLRYEYKYLEKYLESILESLRDKGFLGNKILGDRNFDFDISIQFGAGSYVCGEESALIESAEGKRGEPRERPPFPVECGYLSYPTIVNNVETLCSVVKIMEHGATWYKSLGTPYSTGNKVLSISGDCRFPGIYEIEWGFNIHHILEMAGADEKNVLAVQVGGPSGSCISPKEFSRTLDYADLATGGSFIIIGKKRNLLKDVILNFTSFFAEESCGSCAPCRIGTLMLKKKLEKILAGQATVKDLTALKEWAKPFKTSRCGLGQTAANPILSSLRNFPGIYEMHIKKEAANNPSFSLEKALQPAREMFENNVKSVNHETKVEES